MLRLRRWAVVALTRAGLYEVQSWHLTERGAQRRRTYIRCTNASRDLALYVMPWFRAKAKTEVSR